MKIRTNTGVIEFKNGHVGPAIGKAEFLASIVGTGAKLIVSNGPFETYRFVPEAGIAATVSFNGNRLASITVLMEMPTDKDRLWTEELELRRKGVHDEWLRTTLGSAPYRYIWGDVVSNFDAKGCISDIIISYAN